MKDFFLVLLLAILAVGLTSCWGYERADVCSQREIIARLETENFHLNNEIERLKEELSECESKLTPAPNVITTSRPLTITTTRPTRATTPATVTPARSPVAQTTAPAREPRVGQASLNHLRQNGEILFCVAANGREDRYFPIFGIERGVAFVGIADNEIKGFNWKVEPTEFMEGDYGVTMDGTFYVSDALIRTIMRSAGEDLHSMKIKSLYTNWEGRPMTLDTSSGYWVFETMR